MPLSREDVKKVSLLARLDLTEKELDRMTEQLGHIVTYVETLSELNTDDIEPMAHALEISNVFADDRVEPGLDRTAALANAPQQDGEFYLVPAVLGQ